MQQQPQQMIPVMPSFPPANITTEQIQQFLDENKKLILAILDNQNLGKLAECAQFQAQLQKNLMYLAAIADAQPQTPTMPPQMAPHPAMQQGGYYMPHPQAAAMAQQQQQGLFPPKMPSPYNTPHHMQEQHQQQQLRHQQAIQGQMGMRPLGTAATSGGPSGGNRHDGPEAVTTGGADGKGSTAAEEGK